MEQDDTTAGACAASLRVIRSDAHRNFAPPHACREVMTRTITKNLDAVVQRAERRSDRDRSNPVDVYWVAELSTSSR